MNHLASNINIYYLGIKNPTVLKKKDKEKIFFKHFALILRFLNKLKYAAELASLTVFFYDDKYTEIQNKTFDRKKTN